MENKGFLKTMTGKIVLGVIILIIVIGIGVTALTVTGRIGGRGDVVGEDKAKAVALEHAGVKEADAARIKVRLDYDDGFATYEVEFYYNQQEYDYNIDAETGDILNYDGPVNAPADNQTATDNQITTDNAATTDSQNNGETYISEEKAKETAAAKVSGMNAADVTVHMDKEDGRTVYEGQFFYNNLEYDFTIDAVTGAVLDWSEDND